MCGIDVAFQLAPLDACDTNARSEYTNFNISLVLGVEYRTGEREEITKNRECLD